MNLYFNILLIFSVFCASHLTLNNYQKGNSFPVIDNIGITITEEESDSCSNPFQGSNSEYLSAFLKSGKDCERGYFISDTSGYYLKKVFLNDISKQFAFAFFERDSLSVIYTLENGEWTPFFRLTGFYSFFNSGKCNCLSKGLAVPELRLLDFNGDHIDDIQIVNTVNVNGNEYSTLCITDTINKTLLIPGYIFSNPEYNAVTRKLQEVEWAGITRNEFHASYTWKGLNLYPDYMLEYDKSDIDWDKSPASGLKFNVYKGRGGVLNDSDSWKLVKSYREPSEKVIEKWFKEAGIEW